MTQLMEMEIAEDIPLEIGSKLKIAPLPRNGNPQHHEGRRTARAQTLGRLYCDSKTIVFTDAADYGRANTKTAVVTALTGLIAGITLRKATIIEAEEVALALTQKQDHYHRLASDVSKVHSLKDFQKKAYES